MAQRGVLSLSFNSVKLHEGAIRVDSRGNVLHATIIHAPVNMLDLALVESLQELVSDFEQGTAKVLVISSGVPGYFASGSDLQAAGVDSPDPLDYRDALCDALGALARCRRPTIAALDGHALSAGLELAITCTLRFASRNARFGLPEVRSGMIPSGGATQRLPALIGRGRALELMLSGREISCEEGERIGLVDRVLGPDVASEALELAETLAGFSAPAMAAIMCCVDASRDLSHEDGLTVERVALASMFEDRDAVAAITTIVEDNRAAFQAPRSAFG